MTPAGVLYKIWLFFSAQTETEQWILISDRTQARDSLLAAFGFASYARVIAEFTRGERAASRAWSAAVDGYLDEAIKSLELAREVFAGVSEILES